MAKAALGLTNLVIVLAALLFADERRGRSPARPPGHAEARARL
jgi:hypothetical protein